jgi:hypothetical protein
MEAMNGETDDSVEQFVSTQSRLHVVLASLARNKVLQLSLMVTGQIITRHIAALADPRRARGTIEHDHVLIARAVAAGHARKRRTRSPPTSAPSPTSIARRSVSSCTTSSMALMWSNERARP